MQENVIIERQIINPLKSGKFFKYLGTAVINQNYSQEECLLSKMQKKLKCNCMKV
jgi:hypothetical protein